MARALLSVADKAGIVPLAGTLVSLGWELIATEGTAALLAEHNLPVRSAAAWMNLPPLLDGRVKTLHHKVFLALMCRGDRPAQIAQAASYGVQPIDLLAGGFYRFRADDPAADLTDSIDIGGPAMMRAAAKNHSWVITVVDPADNDRVAGLLTAAGGAPAGVAPEVRRELAAKVFHQLSAMDTRIAAALGAGASSSNDTTLDADSPGMPVRPIERD